MKIRIVSIYQNSTDYYTMLDVFDFEYIRDLKLPVMNTEMWMDQYAMDSDPDHLKCTLGGSEKKIDVVLVLTIKRYCFMIN